MADKSEQWYAGSNEEWFNMGPFESRDEAISEGRNCWPDRHFFIGQAGEYHPFSRDYVEEMLELEACAVSDECGSDAADNWPPRFSRKDADCTAANEKIVEILKELCGDCTVFPIEGSERIEMAVPNA